MISWAYGLGGRALDYVLGGSVPPPRDEKTILQDMEVQAPKETKRLYGTVTEMRDDYCLVDHRYHLQLNSLAKIGNHQPKLDDTVCVILTRRGQEQEWVVDHLVEVCGDCWDDTGGGGGGAKTSKIVENDSSAVADTRFTGSVVDVRGSKVEVALGSDRIVFDLKATWKESFNPVKFDMIQLDVKLGGEDLEDLSGCCVLAASPARKMSGDGDISLFFMNRNEAIIAGMVFVWPEVCPHNYTPRRGDTVRYHSVECVPVRENHNSTWRATRVVPKDVDGSRPVSLPREMLVGSREKLEHQAQLFMNKEGVSIEEQIDFGCVALGESVSKEVTVKNESAVNKTLINVIMKKQCPNDVSQFCLTVPEKKIASMSSGVVKVTCTASQIGRTKELAVFDFGDFSIGRHLMMEATHPNALNKSADFRCTDIREKKKMPIGIFNQPAVAAGATGDGLSSARLVVPGRRKMVKKAPTFIKNRMKEYAVPKAMLEELQYEDMVGSELIDRFPVLAEELSSENHEMKFKALLHMEEIAELHELQKHNMSSVVLQRAGPYLSLTVPGLVEKRPSLVLGDSAILSVPGDTRAPCFEGCVNEVRASDVLLKFDEKFHMTYCGEVYDVAFKISRGPVRRQHQAVEMASQQLGYEVLFPEKVALKQPQTCFVVENEAVKTNNAKINKTFTKFKVPQKRKLSPDVSLEKLDVIEEKSNQNCQNDVSAPNEPVSSKCDEISSTLDVANIVNSCDKGKQTTPVEVCTSEVKDDGIKNLDIKKTNVHKSQNGSLQFVPRQVQNKSLSKQSQKSGKAESKLSLSPALKNTIKERLKNPKNKKTASDSWNPSWPDEEEDDEDIVVESEAEISWEEADILIQQMTNNNVNVGKLDEVGMRNLLEDLIDEALGNSEKDITEENVFHNNHVSKDENDTFPKENGLHNEHDSKEENTLPKENGFHKEEEEDNHGSVLSPTEPISNGTKEDSKQPHPRKKSISSDNLLKRAIMNNYPKSDQPEISSKSANSQIFFVPVLETSQLKNCPSKRFTPPDLPELFTLDRVLPPYPGPAQATSVKWINRKLNPEQKSAVLRILSGEARPLPYVIYGPPGTGKTVTLVESILQIFLLRPDARILVSTPSNSSADLIAERLHASGKIRFGDLARLNAFQRNIDSVPEQIKPFCFVNDELEDLEKASRHKIVVSTCATAGGLYKLELRHGHFTHVLIDEAGHTTEPECLIPLGLVHADTGQVVLAGDPKQLGPVLQSSLAKLYGLEQSFLERLTLSKLYQRDEERFRDHGNYDPALLTKLVRNYRSHKDILSLPSRLFYDDELVPCADEAVQNKFCEFELLPTKGHPVVFHGVRGRNMQEADCPSWFNPQEAFQTVLYLRDLLEAGIASKDIGIIAPYRKQASKIREMIETFKLNAVETLVGSVEEFQGQERSCIIMTTVRSSGDYTESDVLHGLGFLRSEKRFNVAVTRAKSLLVVLGDPHILAADITWREFLVHVIQIGGYKGCDLPLGLQT